MQSPSIWSLNGRVRIYIKEMGNYYTPEMSYMSAKDLSKKLKMQKDMDIHLTFFNDKFMEMSINPEYVTDIELETV